MVLDETTEEGRLFQTVIVLGKKGIFRASPQANGLVYDARVRLILGWVPAQVFVFIKRHCTGVYLRRRLRRTAPCGNPGKALEFVKNITDATGVPPSPAGPPGLLHLSSLSFIIGMPNRSCILKLRPNQCFVCNFLSMPRCQCQIAPKKTQSLGCLACNFGNMLIPIKINCDS